MVHDNSFLEIISNDASEILEEQLMSEDDSDEVEAIDDTKEVETEEE